MTLPVYPDVPSEPLSGSWAMAPAQPPLQTDLGGGNLRRRRLPGSDTKILTQKIRMSGDDWTTLSVFIDNDLSGGVSRFTMPVWTGSEFVSKTVQFMDDFPHPSDFNIDWVEVDMKLRVYAV